MNTCIDGELASRDKRAAIYPGARTALNEDIIAMVITCRLACASLLDRSSAS